MGSTQQERIHHINGLITSIILHEKIKNKLEKKKKEVQNEYRERTITQNCLEKQNIPLSGMQWMEQCTSDTPTREQMRLNNKVFSFGCRRCTEYRDWFFSIPEPMCYPLAGRFLLSLLTHVVMAQPDQAILRKQTDLDVQLAWKCDDSNASTKQFSIITQGERGMAG